LLKKKALILENNVSLDEIIISGSYWFKIEMAYGLNRLGYTTSLIQQPSYQNYPWIKSEQFSNQDSSDKIQEIISKYDVVILLADIPLKDKFEGNDKTKLIYWDIEGFPNSKSFFDNEKEIYNKNNPQYYGAKFSSVLDVLRNYQFHLTEQKLQYWEVDDYFSAAKNPIIRKSSYLPLGSEPELYKQQNLIKRDIAFSIIGSTNRWFQAQERLSIAEIMLKRMNYPLAYWFGSMPESNERMPTNCFPMGHIDYFSLPNYLMRSKKILHIPRPYHLISECQSATIFQAAAAGAIPIHHFKNCKEANKIGYFYEDIVDINTLSKKSYPESFTYKSRFQEMVDTVGGL